MKRISVLNQEIGVFTNWLCLGFHCVELLLLWKMSPLVTGSSLSMAWKCGAAAWCGQTLVTILRLLPVPLMVVAPSLPDYVVATLLLTPLISVLGARQPGARAWTMFVVLPMVIVLAWPALLQAWNSSNSEPIQLGSPALMGFLLVLLMGYGNYFGSGLTLAASLYAGAVICRVWSTTGWSATVPHPVVAELLLCSSGMLVLHRVRQIRNWVPLNPVAACSRLWIIFRDLFGIVWAKRVMDRMNLFSERENWEVRLTLDGFVATHDTTSSRTGSMESSMDPVDSAASPELTSLPITAFVRPATILLWLLRRFVSPNWTIQWLGEFEMDLYAQSADSGSTSNSGPPPDPGTAEAGETATGSTDSEVTMDGPPAS